MSSSFQIISVSCPSLPPEEPATDSVKTGALASLWMVGKTVPMLSPSEATTTSAILSRLSLPIGQPKPAPKSSKLKISFDVYLPTSKLKKSVPKIPSYRVVVDRSDSDVPTSADVRATLGSLTDAVPVLFAVVSTTHVSFFDFAEVCLPTNSTIEDNL